MQCVNCKKESPPTNAKYIHGWGVLNNNYNVCSRICAEQWHRWHCLPDVPLDIVFPEGEDNNMELLLPKPSRVTVEMLTAEATPTQDRPEKPDADALVSFENTRRQWIADITAATVQTPQQMYDMINDFEEECWRHRKEIFAEPLRRKAAGEPGDISWDELEKYALAIAHTSVRLLLKHHVHDEPAGHRANSAYG